MVNCFPMEAGSRRAPVAAGAVCGERGAGGARWRFFEGLRGQRAFLLGGPNLDDGQAEMRLCALAAAALALAVAPSASFDGGVGVSRLPILVLAAAAANRRSHPPRRRRGTAVHIVWRKPRRKIPTSSKSTLFQTITPIRIAGRLAAARGGLSQCQAPCRAPRSGQSDRWPFAC